MSALLALGIALGVVASALVIPMAAAAGQVVGAGQAVFDAMPSTLPESALPQRSVMLAADGEPIAWFYDENRVEVPLEEMSPLVQQAMVAIEDARFFQHGPIDPRGMVRAVVIDRAGGSPQGASTLTQQYVKNVLLEEATQQGDPAAVRAAVARTPARKLREMRLAITVEQQLTKRQILQRYLNIVYFGQRVYGVQAAAERYFGVSAARLTLPQAALLAGMVQDPSADDPVAHPDAAQRRRDVVLTAMNQQGLITSSQLAAALDTPVTVRRAGLPEGCAGAGVYGYFCSYVVQSVVTGSGYGVLGTSAEGRRHALQIGGLTIRTTLDVRAQRAAKEAVDRAIPPDDDSRLGTAAVTVVPGTGAVTAMVQNRTFGVRAATGQTSVNYATDNLLGGASGFQTGSSFKPFTLAAWLARGRRLEDTVDATRREFPFSDFTACGQRLRGSQPYLPSNSEGSETGPMSVLQATVNSVNVAYVDMESQLDLCDIAATAQRLGVHLASAEKPECSTGGSPGTDLPTCLPSLTLGVKDIAPLTMAAAYAGFASGGVYCTPRPITSISRSGLDDAGSTTVASFDPDCRRALDPAVAAGVTQALRQVLTTGTAAAVGPLDGRDSAGKTGTTDGPYDTWFVGYTAQRSTAVWVADPGRTVDGRFRRRELTDLDVAGAYYPTVFGASIAAPVWKAVMTGAMQGLPAQPLP